ncbi:MAG: hypothetical protein WBN77_15600 [Desulfobacterales bacterium]
MSRVKRWEISPIIAGFAEIKLFHGDTSLILYTRKGLAIRNTYGADSIVGRYIVTAPQKMH